MFDFGNCARKCKYIFWTFVETVGDHNVKYSLPSCGQSGKLQHFLTRKVFKYLLKAKRLSDYCCNYWKTPPLLAVFEAFLETFLIVSLIASRNTCSWYRLAVTSWTAAHNSCQVRRDSIALHPMRSFKIKWHVTNAKGLKNLLKISQWNPNKIG